MLALESRGSVRWLCRPLAVVGARLRRLARIVLGKRIEFEALPLLERQSAGWDSAVELRPPTAAFPTGWVQLHFDLRTDVAFLDPPTLYVDCGAGYSRSSCIRLPYPRGGTVRTTVKLPSSVRGLRFAPLDREAVSRLGTLTMKEIAHLEAAIHVHAPLAKEILSEPGRPRRALGKAWHAFREGGLSALRERIRDRTRRNPRTYSEWIAEFDTLSDGDQELIRARVQGMPSPPLFSLVMRIQRPAQSLQRTIESVQAQLYPHWELCIADHASHAAEVRPVLEKLAASDQRIKIASRPVNGDISGTSSAALDLASGEFAVLLNQDGELSRHALYMLAEELLAHPNADVMYSDEDKIDEAGNRYDPCFKPDWNADLLSSHNYFSNLVAYRRSLLHEVVGFRNGLEGSEDYDLALRCVARTQSIRHVPSVLYHRRPAAAAASIAAQSAAQRALSDHLRAIDPRIRVEPGLLPATCRVRYPVPDPAPLVSVLIPTRDCPDILRRCIESIYARTGYPNLEIIVVDNQSSDRLTHRYFEELEKQGLAQVFSYPHAFNYAAINNFAARQARGEILCLLNNDVEVISAEWLEELVSHVVRPGVATVGAKLLYPDGTIQHSGVITGLCGIAGHVHRHLPRNSSGYAGRAQMVQQITVVTGACLAVRKSVFKELSGFDEENLPVAFNDVDFCLRAVEAGHRNIYTPYAELYHHESYSRGSDDTPEKRTRSQREIEYMYRRWGDRLPHDPFYNPNLSLFSEHCTLAWPPRAPKPWKKQVSGQ